MKLTFILPAIGKKKGKKYIGTWKMEPLTIAVLKALTPPDIETTFFDDRIELIDYEAPTDLVVISVETYTARRSYDIASIYREKGVKVILGGYHVTLLPDEALEYADAIIIGNAENVWQQMLNDFQNHTLKKEYTGEPCFNYIRPDKSIFDGKKYLPVSLIETGRGCCHRCEFCAISGYYLSKYYPREHDDIIADIRASKHKYFFMVDDNLIANRKHALELFKKMEPLKIKWAGQGTLSLAKDEELLTAMKRSGCEIILIGFETLQENNLQQMNKSVNIACHETDKLVQRIHDEGIGIYATFVFGYDNDTPETFARTLAFAQKHNFYTAAFNHLLPFPGTPLYSRLKEENKLIYDKWWLEEDYHYGSLAFYPQQMSPEELSCSCLDLRKRFAGFKTVIRRGIASMKRSSPLMWSLFWAMNLRLGEEVSQKMNVPIGLNLDEYPK